MKHRHGLNLLGILFIASGLVFIGYIAYRNIQMDEERKRAIENNTIKVESENSDTEDTDGIEVLTSDMKVREVKSYKDVITIPSLGIVAPINEGVTSSAMATGVGHFTDTPKIGKLGNSCYAGHYSDIYNCIFNKLPDIEIYAPIVGYDSKGKKCTYYVVNKYVTEPSNLGVLADTSLGKRITIVTCSNKGTKRLIVEGVAFSDKELESYREEQLYYMYESIYDMADSIGSIKVSDYINFKGRILNNKYPVCFKIKNTRRIKDSFKVGGFFRNELQKV